jgi:hypothetical protein
LEIRIPKRFVTDFEIGSTALLDAVRIYHRILPADESEYRAALMAAYQAFCRERETGSENLCGGIRIQGRKAA